MKDISTNFGLCKEKSESSSFSVRIKFLFVNEEKKGFEPLVGFLPLHFSRVTHSTNSGTSPCSTFCHFLFLL